MTEPPPSSPPPAPLSIAPHPPQRSPLPWFRPLADLADVATYRVGLYLLLALPVGALGFGLLVAGLNIGAATLPLLVGFPILLLSLLLVVGLTWLQRGLARWLLGVQFPAERRVAAAGAWPWLKHQLTQPATYRALVFHLLQLWAAALCWVVLSFPLGLSLGALLTPLWQVLGWPVLAVGSQVVPLNIWSTFGLMLAGAGGLILTAALTQLLGKVWAAAAWVLLRPDDPLAQAQRAVQVLGRAAGRLALGEDLGETLQGLVGEAQAGSAAVGVQLVRCAKEPAGGPPDKLLAQAGEPFVAPCAGIGAGDAAAALTRAGVFGPQLGEWQGRVLVRLPVHTAGPKTALLALYAPNETPSREDLTLLSGMAGHAGTALQAAALVERAAGRAEEEERARLARELHDSVSQALYGITLGAKTARATLGTDPEKARASLDYTVRLAEGAVGEMKALVFSLRPDALAEGGLVPALERQVQALRLRHGLEVTAAWAGEPELTSEVQTAAYRIAQEALHNVVKHARASHVELRLAEAGGGLQLTVRDNGKGFDVGASSGGSLGQRSMRERAARVGGRLQVSSALGGGTCLQAWFPLAGRGARAYREETK